MNLERELQADLQYLELKAVKLIDQVNLVQDLIDRTKCRLKEIGTYPLPDGRTQ